MARPAKAKAAMMASNTTAMMIFMRLDDTGCGSGSVNPWGL